MEGVHGDKRASLLRAAINYSDKKIYSTGPGYLHSFWYNEAGNGGASTIKLFIAMIIVVS